MNTSIHRHLQFEIESFPLNSVFRISRGSRTTCVVVSVSVEENGTIGRGECTPYARYDETPTSVCEQIETMRPLIEKGLNRIDLLTHLKPGAARNAIDCALWDLEAKQSKTRVQALINGSQTKPLTTSLTLSLDTPEAMARQAQELPKGTLIKLKVDDDDFAQRMTTLSKAVPHSNFIIDANESWTSNSIEEHLKIAAQNRVILVEQPLPANDDACLAHIERIIPICADESVHTINDLGDLITRYDMVNIKLDKAGGLTHALELKAHARNLGFKIMVGCMVCSSLAIAPAHILAQDVEVIDIDGANTLKKDRDFPIELNGFIAPPPRVELWG